MQILDANLGDTIKVFDKADFLRNPKDINMDCFKIIASYGIKKTHKEDDKDKAIKRAYHSLKKTNESFFTDDENGIIYIMYKGEKPIVFALYSQKMHTNTWVLELIHTHKGWTMLGKASKLLQISTQNLNAYEGAEEMIAVVNKKNEASLNLHEAFIKKNDLYCYVDEDRTRKSFHINISNIAQQKIDLDQEYAN